MKLKVSRIFCLFLLLAATAAFGALFYTMVTSDGVAGPQQLTFVACAAVTVAYAVLVFNNWTLADRLLICAGAYAVLLLLLLNTLGF